MFKFIIDPYVCKEKHRKRLFTSLEGTRKHQRGLCSLGCFYLPQGLGTSWHTTPRKCTAPADAKDTGPRDQEHEIGPILQWLWLWLMLVI